MNLWLAIWSILDFATINHEPPNPEIAPIVCEYFADDCVDALGIKWADRFEIEQSTRFAFYIVENTEAKWRLWTCGRY